MAKVRRIIAKISPVPYYECAWRTSGAHPIVAAGGDIGRHCGRFRLRVARVHNEMQEIISV
jgi:hypothetical protein